MKTRVLIVDPDEIVRSGVRCMLEKGDDLEVVGDEVDGRRCLERLADLEPDVVITELLLEGLGGVDLTQRLSEGERDVRVLILSDQKDQEQVRAALEAGAMGYVLKGESEEDLVRAVRLAARGKTWLSPDIARSVISPDSVDPVFDVLTSREREVLKLLADGSTSKQIAYRLGLSSKTVDAHRQNIMRKLELDSVADLVKSAIRAGLTSAEPDTAP